MTLDTVATANAPTEGDETDRSRFEGGVGVVVQSFEER